MGIQLGSELEALLEELGETAELKAATLAKLQLGHARAALCDLLIGRTFRFHADAELQRALASERIGIPDLADCQLAQAAHMEWIAGLTEQGRMLFGGRLNRCGYQPRETEE